MATQNNLHVPDELLAELRLKAQSTGVTVEEMAADALRKGLEDCEWQELLAYGRERGSAKGFTEEQAADVVHEWRQAQSK